MRSISLSKAVITFLAVSNFSVLFGNRIVLAQEIPDPSSLPQRITEEELQEVMELIDRGCAIGTDYIEDLWTVAEEFGEITSESESESYHDYGVSGRHSIRINNTSYDVLYDHPEVSNITISQGYFQGEDSFAHSLHMRIRLEADKAVQVSKFIEYFGDYSRDLVLGGVGVSFFMPDCRISMIISPRLDLSRDWRIPVRLNQPIRLEDWYFSSLTISPIQNIDN